MGKGWKKKLKKLVRVGRYYGMRATQVALPIVGAAFLGPAGAALGTAASAGLTAATAKWTLPGKHGGKHSAGYYDAESVKRWRKTSTKQALVIGGAITLGAGIASVAGGTGVAAPLFTGGAQAASSALAKGGGVTNTGLGTSPGQLGADPFGLNMGGDSKLGTTGGINQTGQFGLSDFITGLPGALSKAPTQEPAGGAGGMGGEAPNQGGLVPPTTVTDQPRGLDTQQLVLIGLGVVVLMKMAG